MLCVKPNTLAAAVALAAGTLAAGPAQAAFTLPSTGNGSLVLAAWDSTRSVSYMRTLQFGTADQTLDTFLTLVGWDLGPVGAPTTPVNSSTVSAGTWSFADQDGLFASTFGASTATNILWQVFAFDVTGSQTGANGKRTLTTYGPDGKAENPGTSTSVPQNAFSRTNAGHETMGNNMNILLSNANGSGLISGDTWLGTTSNGGYGVLAKGDPQTRGDDYGVNTAEDYLGAGLADTLEMFYLSPVGGGGVNQVGMSALETAAGVRGIWTLDASGTATFAVVPLPAAVWLFGSALGLVAVLRRRARTA